MALELKNNTDFPDWFIRRMISWICKNDWIEWSTKKIRGGVEVRNRHTNYRRHSGHAYPSRERMVLSIGTLETYRPYIFEENENGRRVPVRNEDGTFKLGEPDPVRRIRAFVRLTAHELAHLAQYDRPKERAQYSEREAERLARLVLGEFEEREAELTEAWMKPPAYADRPKKPKPTLKERNAAKARAKLKEWQRKEKLAKTKRKKYEKAVRRYEKEGVL
jgi:hypothetical protein